MHAAVARSAFSSQNVQNAPLSDHFLTLRCGKLHAAVARSTFQSQNVQNTPCSDHFLKSGSGKIADRCSEKDISKSKCRKHTILGPFFEVGMWKNCTQHLFNSKCTKHQRFEPVLGVRMSKRCPTDEIDG